MTAPLVFGEYSRKIDERYRLSFPTEPIEELFGTDTSAVLVKEQTGALSLWPAHHWKEKHDADLALLQQKLAAGRLQQRQTELQALGRLLSTRHREVQFAGRSRLLIPEGFREFLGAEPGDEVVIVGAAVCLEVWRVNAWQEHLQTSIPDFNRLMDQLTQ